MSEIHAKRPLKRQQKAGKKNGENSVRAKQKRQYEDSGTRRQQIMEVADTLFMANGFLATGVKEIVKAVGISYGSFYYHFPTKRDILLAFAESRATKLQQSIEGWNKDDKIPPDEQMARLLDLVDSFRSYRMSIDFIKGAGGREDPELYNTFVNQSLPRLTSSIGKIFEAGNKRGIFRVVDSKGTALLFSVMTLELLHRVAGVKSVIEWKDIRRTHRITVARMIGVADDRFL